MGLNLVWEASVGIVALKKGYYLGQWVLGAVGAVGERIRRRACLGLGRKEGLTASMAAVSSFRASMMKAMAMAMAMANVMVEREMGRRIE